MKKTIHNIYGASVVIAFALFCTDLLMLWLTKVDMSDFVYWREIASLFALLVLCVVMYERTK